MRRFASALIAALVFPITLTCSTSGAYAADDNAHTVCAAPAAESEQDTAIVGTHESTAKPPVKDDSGDSADKTASISEAVVLGDYNTSAAITHWDITNLSPQTPPTRPR